MLKSSTWDHIPFREPHLFSFCYCLTAIIRSGLDPSHFLRHCFQQGRAGSVYFLFDSHEKTTLDKWTAAATAAGLTKVSQESPGTITPIGNQKEHLSLYMEQFGGPNPTLDPHLSLKMDPLISVWRKPDFLE
jgi:hypothetical protein